MDPARLAELKSAVRAGRLIPGKFTDERHILDLIEELIAALKQAWMERDNEYHGRQAMILSRNLLIQQKADAELRAARAEAEVERQQSTINNQAESIRVLYGMFLAAREVDWERVIRAIDAEEGQNADQIVPGINNLRRILDAAQDPAR